MQSSSQQQHKSDGQVEGRNHATTPSLGSSVSFHTVHTSPTCAQVSVHPFQDGSRVVQEVCLTASSPGREESLDAYSTPLGMDEFRSSTSSESGCLNEELDWIMQSGEEGEGRGQAGQEEAGHAIKCLPNGMRSLPPPSDASRSLDLSSSPCSRPSTLVSVVQLKASASSQRNTGTAQLQTVTRTSETPIANEEEESCVITTNAGSESSSSTRTMTTGPSQPSSSTTPTSHRRERHYTAKSTCTITSSGRPRAVEAPPEWGANFWCVISDPTSAANTFFANPQTGECRWVLPKGTIVLPPSGSGEWWELVDEATGVEYYYHTETRETRWTKPEAETELVIPLRAVQMSRHLVQPQTATREEGATRESQLAAWRTSKRMASAQDRIALRGEQGGEDPAIIITTPLRPRTKSLPKQQRQRQVSHSTKRAPSHPHSRGQDQYLAPPAGIEEDLAMRARRSIVLRDQRALALARQASTPTLPACSGFRTTKRQPRPATTACTATTEGTSSSSRLAKCQTLPMLAPHQPSAPDSGQGLGLGLHGEPAPETAAWPIRKLGKGLAYQVGSPTLSESSTRETKFRLRTRRSVPFLSPTASPSTSTSTSTWTGSGSRRELSTEERQIVGLPSDVVHALAKSVPTCTPQHSHSLHRHHATDAPLEKTKARRSRQHKDKQEQGKKRTKLRAWKSLTRCTRPISLHTSTDTPSTLTTLGNSTRT